MKKALVKIGLLFVVLINILFVSCKENETEYVTELSFNSKEFNENKAKWENKKPLNYQFDYEVFMGINFTSVHVTSTVKDGVCEPPEYKIDGENLGERPAPKETLTEDELFEEDSFLREVYDFLDMAKNKLETIDDYIAYLEKRIKELNSVDFEEEKYTEYELIIFYDSDCYFPYRYEIHYTKEKEDPIIDGTSSGISGGISNFKVLN